VVRPKPATQDIVIEATAARRESRTPRVMRRQFLPNPIENGDGDNCHINIGIYSVETASRQSRLAASAFFDKRKTQMSRTRWNDVYLVNIHSISDR